MNTTNGNVYICTDATATAAVWFNTTSVGNMTVDVFNAGADFTVDVTTQLTLSDNAGSENNLWVNFDGVVQQKNQYTLSGTTLTFSSAIPTGVTRVEVQYGTVSSIGTPADNTITYPKFVSGIFASVSDLIAGTASKIINAATFKSYMDDNVKRIVATGTIAEDDTELDNIGDGIFRDGYNYILEVTHEYKANSTNGGPNLTYYNNADVEQTGGSDYTWDGQVDAHSDGDSHIQVGPNYNWGVGSFAQFTIKFHNPKNTSRITMSEWSLYGINTSPTTVYDLGAGHHKTVLEVNKVKIDLLVASQGGVWTLYEEKAL